jgi:putative transposase
MPHHVTQRGNRRMTTFFCEADYRAYLSLLAEWSRRCEVRVWAYCLMPNHVHLILVPSTPEGLSEAVGQVHQRYTRRINFREKWRGYLWQGRFGSFVLDDTHLLRATAYVERNPVAAGLVSEATAWPWSSAPGHVAVRGDAIAEGAWLADRVGGWVCTWGEYLAESDGEETGRLLHRHESTGRPLGDRSFVEQVSAATGRDLVPKKPGRKRKK